VVEKDIQLWSEFTGRLVAVEQAAIHPRVSGTIEEVRFTDGAMVNKGDTLFVLDKKPYQAEFDRAIGARDSAAAQAGTAAKEAARAEKLFKDKALSQKEYEQRENDLQVANANLASATAALETARINLDYTEIKAPISGRAGRAEITAGNLVEAGSGAPVLTTIVSATPIYAGFEMDEATFLHYIGAVAGDVTKIPVELGLAAETGATRAGHVQSFDNRLNPGSGTIRVRAVFDNPDGALVPGLFARVLIGGAAPRHAVLIADRAVGTDQNKKFVLVVGDDNKAEYREVRLGPAADGLRIVEEGLKGGERVILSGLQRARPGAPVTPQEMPMDAKDQPPEQSKP
jgi:multidrug efflux system membrane fusion protein